MPGPQYKDARVAFSHREKCTLNRQEGDNEWKSVTWSWHRCEGSREPQSVHRGTIQYELEQLERLRSEDTPRRPMIIPYYWQVYFESQVHIIDQLISDPKSKQGERRKIRKICEKLKFYNFVIDLTLNTPSDGSDYLWQTWK